MCFLFMDSIWHLKHEEKTVEKNAWSPSLRLLEVSCDLESCCKVVSSLIPLSCKKMGENTHRSDPKQVDLSEPKKLQMYWPQKCIYNKFVHFGNRPIHLAKRRTHGSIADLGNIDDGRWWKFLMESLLKTPVVDGKNKLETYKTSK